MPEGALREQALAHAESCGPCARLLTETESLDFALHAISVQECDRRAPSHVEAALLQAFRQEKQVSMRPTNVVEDCCASYSSSGVARFKFFAAEPSLGQIRIRPVQMWRRRRHRPVNRKMERGRQRSFPRTGLSRNSERDSLRCPMRMMPQTWKELRRFALRFRAPRLPRWACPWQTQPIQTRFRRT